MMAIVKRPRRNERPFPVQRKLKAEMELRGLTSKTVADGANMSYGYVVRVLNGFAHSASALEKIETFISSRPKKSGR